MLLAFCSISLCRVAFICDIYKMAEAPGTKEDGAEWGKVLSKQPAKMFLVCFAVREKPWE